MNPHGVRAVLTTLNRTNSLLELASHGARVVPSTPSRIFHPFEPSRHCAWAVPSIPNGAVALPEPARHSARAVPSAVHQAVGLPKPTRHGVRVVLSNPIWTICHAQTRKARSQAVPLPQTRWTRRIAQSGLPAHHALRVQMDGPIRGVWHCPSTVPCGFGRTDNSVRAQWHYVVRMDGPVRDGRDCPCSMLWSSGGQTLRFEANGMTRAPCLAGSGGCTVLLGVVTGRWMVRLGAVGTASAPRLVGSSR